MQNLSWANHQYWIKVEMKFPGSSSYTTLGATQLLSVPYALYAADADIQLIAGTGIEISGKEISALDESPDNELQTLTLFGNELTLSHGGGSVFLPEYTSDAWTVNGNTISSTPTNNRVAIGTPQSTDAKLLVTATGNDIAGKFNSVGSGTAVLGIAGGTGHGVFGGSTDGIGGTFTSLNGTAGFFSSNGGKALITDQGNVGIGTTDPTRKLQVNGSTLLLNPNGIALETAGKVGIGVTNPVYKFEVNGTGFFENNSGPSLLIGNGNIGIGTTNPTYKLTLIGGGQDGIYCSSSTGHPFSAVSESIYPAGYFSASQGVAGFFTSASDFCIQAQQGGVGSAGADQGILLKYTGDNWKMFVDGGHDYNFAYNNVLKAWIYDTDGSYHNSSDRSLKKNIRPFDHVLDRLTSLQAYTYHMKSAADDSPLSVGFMADEVENVFPELVAEKEGYKSLCYDHFAVLSVEAIKEQQKQIESLEEEIQELKTLVNALKAHLESTDEK